MRENRPSGSEGGATLIPSSLPLSFMPSLRDKNSSSTPVRKIEAPPPHLLENEVEDEDDHHHETPPAFPALTVFLSAAIDLSWSKSRSNITGN
jgi:hypothetical protein